MRTRILFAADAVVLALARFLARGVCALHGHIPAVSGASGQDSRGRYYNTAVIDCERCGETLTVIG